MFTIRSIQYFSTIHRMILVYSFPKRKQSFQQTHVTQYQKYQQNIRSIMEPKQQKQKTIKYQIKQQTYKKFCILEAQQILNTLFLNFIELMEPEEPVIETNLSKAELQASFNSIFEDENNTICFQCGKKTKQWAENMHAIFLCLNCAALYKEVTWAAKIKSISLDLWNKNQIQFLKRGGNKRFKEFLAKYGLVNAEYNVKLRTKAAQYYRTMLMEQSKGHQAPAQPTYEQGNEQYKHEMGMFALSFDQMLVQAKQKTFWLGSKTKEYGVKAYEKAHQKVVSGELKQDSKVLAGKVVDGSKAAATKIAEGSQFVWGFLKQKYAEYSKKNDSENMSENLPDNNKKQQSRQQEQEHKNQNKQL